MEKSNLIVYLLLIDQFDLLCVSLQLLIESCLLILDAINHQHYILEHLGYKPQDCEEVSRQSLRFHQVHPFHDQIQGISI